MHQSKDYKYSKELSDVSNISLIDHTNKQTIARLTESGMDQKYDDKMFGAFRDYLGELYKSPQDYLYLSRYNYYIKLS